MTPLAAQCVKQFTLPVKKRDVAYDVSDLPSLNRALRDEFHCFECTEILPMVDELARAAAGQEIAELELALGPRLFLPADQTWMEFKLHPGLRDYLRLGQEATRLGILLRSSGDGWAHLWMVSHYNRVKIGKVSLNSLDWVRDNLGSVDMDTGRPVANEQIIKSCDLIFSITHRLLAIINTPRIIGRRQHMPNRALERRLTQKFGKGKFPLHAWTEIQLSVSKPIEIDDGEPHEAHLTGRRALHFCRAHLRLRNGRIEYVSPHWRGDPAIGIKQSRYAVQP